MRNSRVLMLVGAALLLTVVLVVRWIAGWGLVSVNVRNVPLAKVIKSIERQGGVKISTNADPTTPVTMLIEEVPAFEAIDTLAVAIEADARLAYVAAPTKGQISDVLAAFAANSDPGDWVVFASGFGRGPGGGEASIDPRVITWKPSDSEDKSLQALLDQGAQKTGALFAVPKAWNPVVGNLPKEGRTVKVAKSLVQSAKGTMQELFLVTVQPPRPETAEDDGRRQFSRTVFSPQRGGQRNQEWMAERAQAQIAALPEDQRAEAKRQMDEMRAMWDAVRALPEEERRAKMEELMNDPVIQERMEERRNARDEKTRPEKREDRMRKYLERKKAMKSAPAQS